MMDSLHPANLLIGGLVFAITSVGGLALAGLVVVAIPADYFSRSQGPRFMAGKHPLLRWAAVVLKNLAGVIIVALGIVLAMPGVPGPGLLTIVIGLMLLDFPGKIRLERWLVNRPGVLRTINRLRARYGKPALVIESDAGKDNA